jgi:hypothetical protein
VKRVKPLSSGKELKSLPLEVVSAKPFRLKGFLKTVSTGNGNGKRFKPERFLQLWPR